MKWSARESEDVLVFEIKGGLEGGQDTYQIRDMVKEKLAQGHRKFLINLDKVDFVNSTGIGIIAAVYMAISSSGGKMKISNANEKVSRVMMITKLLDVFESYKSEDDALASFRSWTSTENP
jgi:anti-sigma B factor antagonist